MSGTRYCQRLFRRLSDGTSSTAATGLRPGRLSAPGLPNPAGCQPAAPRTAPKTVRVSLHQPALSAPASLNAVTNCTWCPRNCGSLPHPDGGSLPELARSPERRGSLSTRHALHVRGERANTGCLPWCKHTPPPAGVCSSNPHETSLRSHSCLTHAGYTRTQTSNHSA